MTNQERTELEDKKLRIEVNKMLADMKHDLAHEHHWESQKIYWDRLYFAGIVTLIITGVSLIVAILATI